MRKSTGRLGYGGLVLLAVWVLLCGAAAPAASVPAAPAGPGGSAPVAPAAPAGPAEPAGSAAEGDPGAWAAYLARQLREDPVYVTDQTPRAVPRSNAPAFAKAAKRAGVPTYLILLPQYGAFGERLLGAVHDRLGRDGLYVLLDSSGISMTAVPFGVDVPAAEHAATVAQYELPYDAGPLATFERFVEALRDGDPAGRAETARERYGGDAYESGEEPEQMYPSTTDRENQSFLTGIGVAGAPALVLLFVPYVRRRLRLRREAVPAKGANRPTAAKALKGAKGAQSSKAARDAKASKASRVAVPPQSSARVAVVTVVVAAVLAGLVAFGAALTFDDRTSEPGPPPTAADMTARLDRVATGLGRDPVYLDPESPAPLTAGELTTLRARIDALDVPVYVAAVPMFPEDESAGYEDSFLASVRGRTGERGVYVVADPISDDIQAADLGVGLGTDLYLLPDDIAYPPQREDEDPRLAERLDALLDEIDRAPRTGGDPAPAPLQPPDPVEEDALPSVFSADFGPGLFIGTLAAALLFGLVAGVLALVRRMRAGWRTAGAYAVGSTTPAASGHPAAPAYDAPPDPSVPYLRSTARDELDALAREFEAADPDGAVRRRAWDCLDAAQLLLDHEEDGRIDADAAPADLAAAVALARAGRTVLEQDAVGAADRCCALNPLHGPAVGGRRRVRYDPHRAARGLPLCAACRSAAALTPRDAHVLRLTLPAPDGADRRVPYEDVPGPLQAAGSGIPQLIRRVQEYAGVHD